MGDIVGREIQARDAGRRRPAQDGGGQVAGATAEVEAIAVDRPDEVEEQLGQAAAPAPHLQLVGVAVGGVKARGIAHAVLRMRGRGRWATMRPVPQAENALPARLAWILVLVLLAPPAWADADPAVLDAFARYVATLEARDGATAPTLVTAASLAREEHLRDLALEAPRSTVTALSPSDQLAVLRLRHEFTASELRPLTGTDLVRIAVEEAWSSPKPLAVLTMTGVETTGDTAALHVARAGEPVPVRLVFHREQDAWKLDLTALAHGSDAALAKTLAFRADRAKVSAEEVLRWVIEETSGHLVDKDLWQPLEPN